MHEEERKAPIIKQHQSDGNSALNFILLLVIPFTLAVCLISFLYTSLQPQTTLEIPPTQPSSLSPSTNQDITKPARKIIPQPNCTTEEHIEEVLTEIFLELKLASLDKLTCKPEDVHNSQVNSSSSNHNSSEPRAHFVIYLAVGLLLTSLVAALVDVYKVKGKPSKIKPQLTKRCSLADLTVLRHSRRESMRKDSMVEEQRNPQKTQGAFPTVIYRRASEPLYRGETYPDTTLCQYFRYRKVSLDYQHEPHSNEPHHRMMRRF